MVPTPLHSPRSSRLLFSLFPLLTQHVPQLTRSLRGTGEDLTVFHTYAKRASAESHSTEFIVFACLIPVLVLLSGVFAGLTLGYMSLDETQLNVLSMSGTPQQKRYANKIKPIRKNGHLLLVTLLLANMIVNETLPIVSDPVLGGSAQSVVVSTVLIVIFAEIIPQSLCTRHGLYLGAKMAGFTRVLIYLMGIISWPVAKLLEFVLGPHHGIIYRRAELKELIAMHSSMSSHGGDLNTDTVTIIGATLDLQEKVVKQAMTPIEDVFMLSIDSKLDYELMTRICLTGHSRVPVYEEVEVVVDASGHLEKVKKIIGILLVKHCVLLDPKDAIPLRKIPLNKVPFVPNNESLLGILDKFQEGRSHMAIVSRFSVEKAASVKKVAKRSLTQRLRERVGMGDSSESSDDESDAKDAKDKSSKGISWADEVDRESTVGAGDSLKKAVTGKGLRTDKQRPKLRNLDIEMGIMEGAENGMEKQRNRLPRSSIGLEQSMPADAVLAEKDAENFLQGIDPAIMPLGIITLEDVLEELIGEEIYDEFDPDGANGTISSYVPTNPSSSKRIPRSESSPDLLLTTAIAAPVSTKSATTSPVMRPLAIRGLNFLRSKSAPPSPRDEGKAPPVSSPSHKSTSMAPREVKEISETIPSSIVQNLEAMVTTDEPKDTLERDKEVASPPVANAMAAAQTPRETLLKNRAVNSVGLASASHGSMSYPASRSSSPAPSLEAILLDRRRRLAAAGTAGKDVNIVNSAPSMVDRAPVMRIKTPSIKGTSRFKSSPLGGGERTGMVVAEKVRQDTKAQEEGVLPGDMEQEGLNQEDITGL